MSVPSFGAKPAETGGGGGGDISRIDACRNEIVEELLSHAALDARVVSNAEAGVDAVSRSLAR